MINAYACQKKYQNNGADESDEEILTYLPLVRYHASRLALGLPSHISQDDLVQAGILGLIEAHRRFDPKRNIKFETFATPRIRGAMLDELRSLSWLPRSLFKQIRDLDQTVQKLNALLGREPEDD